MQAREVGKPYSPSRRSWPEQNDLRLSPDGCELVMFWPEPDEQEITDMRKGTAEFAWLDGGAVAVLCFRFGGQQWQDALFEASRVPAGSRGVPAGGPGSQILLQMVLVDASNGIIKGLRTVTWEPGFAQAVRDSVARQLDAPPSTAAANAAAEGLLANSSAQLAAQAPVRCVGSVRPAAGTGADPAPGTDRAAQIISEYIPGAIPGREYPRPLPEALRPWHLYLADAGHSIAVVLASDYKPGKNLGEYLVPAPVKSVLAKGWEEKDGLIVCDLPYDPNLGLLTGPEDDEY